MLEVPLKHPIEETNSSLEIRCLRFIMNHDRNHYCNTVNGIVKCYIGFCTPRLTEMDLFYFNYCNDVDLHTNKLGIAILPQSLTDYAPYQNHCVSSCM